MTLDINIYGPPPSMADCESSSQRHAQTMGMYFVLFLCSILFAHFSYPSHNTNAYIPQNMFLALLGVGAGIFSTYRLIVLCTQLRQFEGVPNQIVDDLADASIPLVAAYCKAVKNQGRSLTWAEATALMTHCRSDTAAYEKVKEHEKTHFWSSILDHLGGW